MLINKLKHSILTNKRSSLLSYWTLRYTITLSLGLLLIGFVSILWLKHTTMNNRLQFIQSFSQETAKYIVNNDGNIIIPNQFYEWIDSTQRKYMIPSQFGLTVFDHTGKTLFYKNGPKSAPPVQSVPKPQVASTAFDPLFPSAPLLIDQVIVTRIGENYAISVPIHNKKSVIGTLAISYSQQALTDIGQQYGLISSLLILSGLLGWLIIYLLLRRLKRAILKVALALKEVENGDYHVNLNENVKEKEIYDLLVSFKGMAARLEQLEELRIELLAGVTHELKTPITSIHGLIRTVRDHVVDGNEADEFLDISLKETQRLKQMVSDLLDFNTFASGKLNIHKESIDLGKLLAEIVYQWGLLYQDEHVEIVYDIPNRSFITAADASRIQQILINLLNNSKQAFRESGKISVSLSEHSEAYYIIQVSDNGSGIPVEEQFNIFERYYRGENKKQIVHGLGLGLTFSKMLATAMDGKLELKESSPLGTSFQLMLPMREHADKLPSFSEYD
jgi:signal transduction histidine kinase